MLIKAIKYIVLLYLVVCGLFYFYQHLLFFQPQQLDVNHALTFPMRIRFREAKLPFDSATVIDVVKFLPETDTPRGVVLFFHGNRYNVEHYSTYAPYFTRLGYECWMPDYPGYGRSRGEISVAILKEISLQLHKMARSQYGPDSVVLYGKSLGSGLAAYVASQRDCALLLLETPYEKLSSVASEYLFMLPVSWLMHEDINTAAYLPEVLAPTLVWHGTHDELIPLSAALRLLPQMKATDRFYVMEGAHHNGVPHMRRYHSSLDSALLAVHHKNKTVK